MNNKIILLVEDNPDDEVLCLHALQRSHLANEVVVAHDGVEALEYLFPPDGLAGGDPCRLPALVLLDLKLPRLDGKEVLARVRAHALTRFLPVVVLTSSSEEQDLVESYSLGVNSYIRKPVDFTQFSETVRQLGLYWLVLNQAPTPNRGVTP